MAWNKIFWIGAGVIIGLIALVFLLLHTMNFGTSAKEVQKMFAGKKYQPEEKVYQSEYGDISIISVGEDTTKPLLVFAHGSPGGWDAYARYLSDCDLQEHFRMISFDRWGYGKNFRGKPEVSIYKQAAILHPVILQNRYSEKVYMMGHSYGGPVIARYAMDYPDEVNGLFFVAPSIDPAQEKVKWYQNASASIFVRWMLPAEIDVCNREILPMKTELTGMLPLWNNIKASVWHFHGTKDVLVPFENADFAQKMLKHVDFQRIDFEGENHFILWTKLDTIKKYLLKLN
ncbi:MAG: alpha/beta hydrolase [Bacteroidia bacterium]|nr:alpha/beta hydrolase [Bacteroidia bacterium]